MPRKRRDPDRCHAFFTRTVLKADRRWPDIRGMTLDEFAAKISRIRSAIERDGAGIGLAMGGDLAALIADRVIQEGKTATGGSFTPYSTHETAAFFFRNKSRRGSADAQVAKLQKARTPLSYSKFRGLNGLKSSTKNFEFTGEMWRDFGVTATRFDGRAIHATLGGKTEAAANKIAWMSGQEGRSIIEPSAAELAQVGNLTARRIQRIIDQHL
jgi:hypothetical protein